MKIRSISAQQQNQQNFGDLKRPFLPNVCNYILEHANKPGNEGVQAVIEKVAHRQRHNHLFDIELRLKRVKDSSEGETERLYAVVNNRAAGIVVSEKCLVRRNKEEGGLYYPLISDTLKEASKDASLRYTLNRAV